MGKAAAQRGGAPPAASPAASPVARKQQREQAAAPPAALLAKAARIGAQLAALFPRPAIPLEHRSHFQLLVAVMLSAQTTDKKVNEVTPELFGAAPDAASMAAMPVPAIQAIIQPIGLAPTKARNLQAAAALLLERHGGEVPATFEELEALPGVGHKTASVVMAQAFGLPAFPVDTHIHRLAQRWGLAGGGGGGAGGVEATERSLKALYPPEAWHNLHLQIIYFGREHCPAQRHDPTGCPICAPGFSPAKAAGAKGGAKRAGAPGGAGDGGGGGAAPAKAAAAARVAAAAIEAAAAEPRKRAAAGRGAGRGGSKRTKAGGGEAAETLIGDSTILLNTTEGGAVLLEPSNAARVARAGQAELERLDRLLGVFRNSYPNAYLIPKSQLRNHNPYREEGQRALKRQKSLPNGDPALGSPGGGGGGGMGGLPGMGGAAPGMGGGGGYAVAVAGEDWVRKCWGVLNAIYADIGPKEYCYNLPAKEVFYKTVTETFPGIAQQYYSTVRNPITFRDIERRLQGGQLDGPQAFADDLRLLFDNAAMFTPNPTDPVHRLAARLRGRFEEAWAGTGFCNEARGRRSNAGVARERFEHSLYEQAPPPQRKDNSKQRQARGGRGAGGGRRCDSGAFAAAPQALVGLSPFGDDLYRAASHEVSSYQEAAAPELPADVMQDVANSIGELAEEHMQAALDLLNDACKVTNEETGEMELDFEFITFDALMKVDTYIREVQGLPPRPPPPAPVPGAPGAGGLGRSGRKRGVQFDDTSEDEDYEEDDSDSE
ncbi:MAG: hypothetical protein J3K34DRAFT_515886 [Monoraphidium minutum]|nr:MAG: hypothetical protein J3K34DRAFT_515886 [Monoraphidium minutum]